MIHIFIINPTSGNGKSLNFYKSLNKVATEEGKNGEIKFIFSKEKGDAINLAQDFSNKYPESIIYSVGGDGTLNEIINGLNSKSKLGIIPTGSGNDFYRVSSKIKGNQKINLGMVNNKKFINIASVGIDANIADTANKIKNSKLKILSYPRAMIKGLTKNEGINVCINGANISNKLTLLAVCNGMYYGNGVPINPNFDLSSNELNIISASKLNRLKIVKLFLTLFAQKPLDDKNILLYNSSSLKISSNNEIICNVDGEIIKSNQFEFKVIEDGITIVNDYPTYVKKAIKLLK